jgi:flagellar protein FliS
MSANAIARYRAIQVTTSTPQQILLMLYDGLFRFMGEARTAMSTGDRARAGERISKAHAILDELFATLDPTKAPELCETLGGVYLFAMSHLVDANVKQDPALVDETIRVLTPLHEAWQIVLKK